MAGEKGSLAGKSAEEIKEDMQRKAMQFQILEADMQVIHEREHALSRRLQELMETRHTIEDLKTVKNASEVLMPLGSGNFISGKISDAKKVLVGVGGGVAIKKSQEDALKFLDKRIEEADVALRELERQYMQVETELRRIQGELQKFTGR